MISTNKTNVLNKGRIEFFQSTDYSDSGAGKMTEEDVKEYENKTCPTCGSCSGMYTANSMNCLTEVLGMGPVSYTHLINMTIR